MARPAGAGQLSVANIKSAHKVTISQLESLQLENDRRNLHGLIE